MERSKKRSGLGIADSFACVWVSEKVDLDGDEREGQRERGSGEVRAETWTVLQASMTKDTLMLFLR